jgi:hypothetical protein
MSDLENYRTRIYSRTLAKFVSIVESPYLKVSGNYGLYHDRSAGLKVVKCSNDFTKATQVTSIPCPEVPDKSFYEIRQTHFKNGSLLNSAELGLSPSSPLWRKRLEN